MAGNQQCRQYLTLQEAVDNVLGSTESVEKDIVIIPPEQGDPYATYVKKDGEDKFHRNYLLPTDVADTLEIHKHKNKECKITSDLQTVQSNEKLNKRWTKTERKTNAVIWQKKISLK